MAKEFNQSVYDALDPNAIAALRALHPHGYTREQINAMITEVFRNTENPLDIIFEFIDFPQSGQNSKKRG